MAPSPPIAMDAAQPGIFGDALVASRFVSFDAVELPMDRATMGRPGAASTKRRG